jgi:hypothetical protein
MQSWEVKPLKPSWEWDESDILSLIENRVPESLKLEFKACDALRQSNKFLRPELIKDVSALANSVGGTIVYGIKEAKVTHEAESLDEGYDPAELKLERFQQIIDDNIERSIEGIRYNSIRLDATCPGKVLLVISVPQSTRSPHMANHHYYKRLEFECKAMEEYEVRERYGRVTFPGKDVVKGWRDDGINPLLASLEGLASRLRSERWSWNHRSDSFNGLREIAEQGQSSPNGEDFISRYSEVSELLKQHDSALAILNVKGKRLFEQVAKSSFLRDAFTWATSDETLAQLAAENPSRFRERNAKEIYGELFGRDRNEQDRFNDFAEWAINRQAPTNLVHEMFIFWQTFGERFRNLVMFPPILEYRTDVEKTREELFEIDRKLITMLKKIRKELSEKHDIAQGSPLPSESFYGYPSLDRW